MSAKQRAWVTCQCGKERQVSYDVPEMLRLREVSACSACSADLGIAMDSCPESVVEGNGVTACGLGWHHDGRCEPMFTEGREPLK